MKLIETEVVGRVDRARKPVREMIRKSGGQTRGAWRATAEETGGDATANCNKPSPPNRLLLTFSSVVSSGLWSKYVPDGRIRTLTMQ